MPYEIMRDGDEYCVHKQDDGKKMGCHATRREAAAQIAALEMAEDGMMDDKAFSLTDYMDKISGAWRNQFTLSDGEYAYVVEVFDSYIIGCYESNGDRREYQAAYMFNEDGEVQFAAQADWVEVESIYTPVMQVRAMIDRLKKTFTSFLPQRDKGMDLSHGAFKAMGNGAWMAAFTNSFLDREDEILTNKAHLGYVDRVQRGFVPMPDLWFYHIPGSKHGKAIWVDTIQIDDGPVAVIAFGEFDRTPAGRKAEKHYLEAGPGAYVLSHGFLAPEWARSKKTNKTYIDVYNTFEITTLPVEDKAEANQYTMFDVKEMTMALSDEKRKEIEARFGNEMIQQIDGFAARVEENVKALQDMGVEFKEFVASRKDDNELAPAAPPEADTALIGELMQDVDAAMTGQEQITAAVQGVMSAVQMLDSRLTETLAGLEKRIKAFDEFMSQTPKGVEDSEPMQSEKGMDEAEEHMKGRKPNALKADESFFGFPISDNGSQG